METTGLTEQSNAEHLPALTLNEDAKYFLLQSGKWANFLGIMGFIGTGLLVLAALFIGTIFSMLAKFQSNPYPAGFGGILSLVYILIAVFYFFFSFYLYQFGNSIKNGIVFHNELQVSAALGKLKSFFKLWGVTTIVIVSLYMLILIGIVIVIPVIKKSSAGNTITALYHSPIKNPA
jgi:hypothetical protein